LHCVGLSERLSKEFGLTTPQLLILRSIRDLGDVTIGLLSNEVNLSQATVTTIIDRLEDRGLVSRRRSEQDRRKVYTTLTREGKKILKNAPAPIQEEFINSFQDLNDWEQSLILSTVQRVAAMMDAGKIDAAPLLDVGEPGRHNN
jgi:DNA-binding MarR family transcriptional regulator